ncbi:hypothetical protein NQV05_01945 [Mycoplasmopsis agalactiae]|uniref:hypothetical protein n=1 Tax=Mycoplasmopsis agalactiae TaxID=2110 RepID=UPI00211C7849|nr:hypothetical protein [Mycoplasmopsis agalactiae]UUM25885.1 hypothetical protein NQV05_01945 [Mycoplasmopsis agalactiae]
MHSDNKDFLFLLQEALHFFIYLKEKEATEPIGQNDSLLEVDKWIETNKETFFIPKGYSKEKWIEELRVSLKDAIEGKQIHPSDKIEKEKDNEHEKRR